MNKKIKLITSVIATVMISTACGSTNRVTGTQDIQSDSAKATQAESEQNIESSDAATESQQEEETSESAKEAEPSVKDSKPYYGEWKITSKVGESKVYALSEEEINSLTGITITFGSDEYKNGSAKIDITGYEEESVSADQFYSDFGFPLKDIGIDKDTVVAVTVGVEGNFVGALFYEKDPDTLIICYEGVFFEAVRISQPAEGSSLKTEADSVSSKVKEYILNGQNDKPEAGKWNWSESFLNQVNVEEVYGQYSSAGGKADDMESFAKYLTENAPVSKDWKSLFEADLLKSYGEKASKYVLLEDQLYQVYVKKDGSEIPYVVVNARTGYYHG